jgi:hypothetical protein
MMFQWVLGFLSGIATHNPPVVDGLGRTDAEGIGHWIDDYCQAHPLDALHEAASALAVEMVIETVMKK